MKYFNKFMIKYSILTLMVLCFSTLFIEILAQSTERIDIDTQNQIFTNSEENDFLLNSGFAGGDGLTPETAFEISTWEHLHNIRNTNGGFFQLINDLDETTSGYHTYASESANGGEGWNPIFMFSNVNISGSDGNGGRFTIKGLYINRNSGFTGIFSRINENTVIRDINIDSPEITTNSSQAGIIAGGIFQNNVTTLIENVHIYNAIINASLSDHVGGFVGNGNNDLTISNSSFSGTIYGKGYVGGLIGESFGTIVGSSTQGTINSDVQAGGLVGRKRRGSVAQSNSTMDVGGRALLGGLIGSIFPNSSNMVTMHQSFATGRVFANTALIDNAFEDYTYIGGLVGATEGGILTEVFTIGTVSGKQYVGGITGYLSENSTITNAYATGNIYSNFLSSGIAYVRTGAVSNVYATGNRGVFNPNIIINSINAIVNTGLQANGYWNTNSSGAVNSTIGTGLSLSQFYQASSFSGFDFSESGPWAIIEGRSFPYLKAIPLDFPPGYIFDFNVVSEFSSNIEILNDGETASIQLTVRNDGLDDLMSDAEVVFSKQNLSDLSFSSGTVTDST